MDIIGDMMIRLKNRSLKKYLDAEVRNSRLIREILYCLYKEGYISGYEVQDRKVKVFLKYKDGIGLIDDVVRISKLSKRCYGGARLLCKKWEFGEFIICSTSRGIISNREVYFNRLNKGSEKFVGGELLFRL